ncbi:MAG: carbohydrate binding family 9 domain-containing protein, partial [Candidatus Latescibacterota bacterium]
MARYSVQALSCLLLAGNPAGSFSQGQSEGIEAQKILNACPVREPIRLDGSLTESAWQDADPAADFIQRELTEGAPPSEKTEVRILYDEENLYIGVKCFDSEPDKILRREMNRDSELQDDDNFAVVIDTFQDRRTAYYFRTNPNGARNDALVAGGESSESWNGVWDAAARVTDFGWSAEMVIPFKTLRFAKMENQEWGINFRRLIRRKNEEVLWTSWGRNDGLLQLTKCGTLTGLASVKRSRQIDFKPYALGGLEKAAGLDPDNSFKYGLDVKYPITSQLTLDLTTLTDFAQVESDREQINLTRFSINYPEKREFFL